MSYTRIPIYTYPGTQALEPYLSDLRPKQRDEYLASFDTDYTNHDDVPVGHRSGSGGGGGGDFASPQGKKAVPAQAKPPAAKSPRGRGTSPPSGSRGNSASAAQGAGNSRGAKPTSQSASRPTQPSAPAPAKTKGRYDDSDDQAYDDDDFEKPSTAGSALRKSNNNPLNYDSKSPSSTQHRRSASGSLGGGGGPTVTPPTPLPESIPGSGTEFQCQFCGAGEPGWAEDQLDAHYLQYCPYLAPCPACTQVRTCARYYACVLCSYFSTAYVCGTINIVLRFCLIMLYM